MSLTPSEYHYLLRHDLVSFIERSFYELNPQTRLLMAPYIESIADHLLACMRGEIKRLIINLPPRYLKSICASVAFPAFWLGHHPSDQIICVSYGQDLSDKLARDTRTIMNSVWYKQVFPTRLSPEKKSVNEFMTTKQGFRMATSVGGVLTGRGADLIIIDDPLKPDDAMSETARKGCIEWFNNTLLSRLNDKTDGCIIIIMQRLHQDDLVGHVLELEDWKVLSFPAIAEEDETHIIKSPLGNRIFTRKAGEVLHPERESLITLEGMRQSMGEYNFSAQYQQNPIPVGGAMVKEKWIMRYDLEKAIPLVEYTSILQSWDTASKSGELNDYSVCTTWGSKDGRYYLLNVFRKRLNYPELKRAVKDLASQYRPHVILIEDKASGTQLIQDLQNEGVLFIKPYEPPTGTDKIMRLHAQTASFEQGKVFLPNQAPWLAEYEREIFSFPGSKYDDQVDSTTQALDHLKNNNALEVWMRLAED